ncbi:MAG: hypothetical protein IJY45_04320 [Tidjanibacter sp.]|nr:hypothetical protein [Tidjanibacter sp.]
MIKRIAVLSLLLFAALVPASAQAVAGYHNVAPYRNEMITFSTRNLAEKGDRTAEKSYIDLESKLVAESQADAEGNRTYTYRVELPLVWRDRAVFLHTRGGGNSRIVSVNGKEVGRCKDEYAPSEFEISAYLNDGPTDICITINNNDRRPAEMVAECGAKPEVFLYSQPPIHIHDIAVEAVPSENGQHGVLSVMVVINSTRSAPEEVSVGYDIYSPEKELKYYDIRDITATGRGQLDTLNFKTNIYGAMERLWSAESPKLYDVTFYVKRNRIITEYLTIKVGFGRTSHNGEQILRNGKAIDIKPVYYNAAESAKTTEADIKRFKKEGKNTILVDYPQPWWFYDICDRVGIYVVDQANINTDPKDGDMSRNGTLANNPEWLGEFVQRQQATWWRSRRHPSVIAYSLGGPSGDGYNMYKCYEWLKSVEPDRPIIYSDGEWNSDLKLPIE